MTTVPQKHAECIKAWADGATIEQRDPNVMLLSMPPHPDTWRDFTGYWLEEMEYRVKPEPPKYPKTRMTEYELRHAVGMNHNNMTMTTQHLFAAANAAIAHAIRDGQVVVPTDHEVMPDRLTQYSTHIINQGRIFGTRKVIDYVSNRLLDAPDMVPTTMLDRVARAVYLACDSIMVDMYNDTALQGIDLTAIIASVKAGVA